MPENFRVIEGVNVTSTLVRCPGCGGTIGVKFDPKTATLDCPFCGLSSKLPAPEDGAVAQELDFNSALQRANVNWGKLKKLVVCTNCGGQALYDAEQITGACPYCGSTSVAPAAENEQIMAPNAVIPFAISREKAHECFTNFMRRSRCVYKEAYNCKLENLTPVYLPFWTYDAYTVSTYIATSSSQAPEGVNYYKGEWHQYCDDVIIYASSKIHHPFIQQLQEFDYERAVPYSPEYLAGIPAERYTVGLNEGWARAIRKIDHDLRKAIEKNKTICYVSRMTTNYYNVKFRYMLAPMYFGTYTFRKKTYQVAINGQTGKTLFHVPRYLLQMIIIAVIAGLLVLAAYIGMMFLFPDAPIFWMYRIMGWL